MIHVQIDSDSLKKQGYASVHVWGPGIPPRGPKDSDWKRKAQTNLTFGECAESSSYTHRQQQMTEFIFHSSHFHYGLLA